MRKCFALLALLLITISGAVAEVSLQRVWPNYHPADDFDRIAEYFGGEEPTDGRLILRSQTAQRGGYYWLVRARASGATTATWQIEVVRRASPTPQVYQFPVNLDAGSQACLLGVTGSDWPDEKERPLAWRLQLIDASGTVLVSKNSFLWAAAPIVTGQK